MIKKANKQTKKRNGEQMRQREKTQDETKPIEADVKKKGHYSAPLPPTFISQTNMHLSLCTQCDYNHPLSSEPHNIQLHYLILLLMLDDVRSIEDARRMAIEMLRSPQAQGARDVREVMARLSTPGPGGAAFDFPVPLPAGVPAPAPHVMVAESPPPPPRHQANTSPRDALSWPSSCRTAAPVPNVVASGQERQLAMPASPLFNAFDFQKCLSFVLNEPSAATVQRNLSPSRPTEGGPLSDRLHEATRRRVEEMQREASLVRTSPPPMPQPLPQAYPQQAQPMAQAYPQAMPQPAQPYPQPRTQPLQTYPASVPMFVPVEVPAPTAAYPTTAGPVAPVSPASTKAQPKAESVCGSSPKSAPMRLHDSCLQRDAPELATMRHEMDTLRAELHAARERVGRVEREFAEYRGEKEVALIDMRSRLTRCEVNAAESANAAANAVHQLASVPIPSSPKPILNSPSPPECNEPMTTPRSNVVRGVAETYRSPTRQPTLSRVSPQLPEAPHHSAPCAPHAPLTAPLPPDVAEYTTERTPRVAISESAEMKQLQLLMRRREGLEQAMHDKSHLYSSDRLPSVATPEVEQVFIFSFSLSLSPKPYSLYPYIHLPIDKNYPIFSDNFRLFSVFEHRS